MLDMGNIDYYLQGFALQGVRLWGPLSKEKGQKVNLILVSSFVFDMDVSCT